MQRLAQTLTDWKSDVIARALDGLVDARLPHYSREDETELRSRMENLLERVLECLVQQCADPAVDHGAKIAEERYRSGYELFEIQASINVLEEVLWQRILTTSHPDEAVGALGRINAVFGIMKDTLAQSYLEVALDAGKRDRGQER